MIGRVAEKFGDDIVRLYGEEYRVVVPTKPFPVMTVAQIYDEIEKRYGYTVPESEKGDLTTDAEHLTYRLAKELYDSEFLFVTDFAADRRPFYHMHDENGVSELPMVRESGTQWVNCDTSPLVQRFYRTITLHSVQGLGPDGKEVPVTFTVTCDDPKAVVWTADNGATVVSGPIGDTRVRYLPIAAKLSVRSEKPLSKIVLKHGTGLGGQVDSFSDFSAAATYAIGKDRAEIVLEKSASALTCAFASAPYSARILGLAQEQKLAERLANAPFSVYNRMSIWGMLNLPPHAVDRTELRRIAARYPETFLGVEQTEWDANFLQKLIHGPTDSYLADLMVGMKIPCTRDEMIRNLYRQWDNYGMMNGSRRFGMSGGLNFQHFGLDAGGTIACYEITDSVGAAARLSNRTNFSAARQFGTPLVGVEQLGDRRIVLVNQENVLAIRFRVRYLRLLRQRLKKSQEIFRWRSRRVERNVEIPANERKDLRQHPIEFDKR